MTASLIAAALLLATPRVAQLPLQSGAGVTAETAGSVTDALTAELRRLHAAEVITPADIGAALGMERQKQLMGCGEQSCLAELAGALDVDQLVTGSLARLGQSWLLQVQRIDARKGTPLAQASRRKKGGSIDDVLDELPSVAKELFGGAQAVPVAAARPPEVPARPAASPIADVALTREVDRSKLVVLTDGKGHYLAVQPFTGIDGPLFAGDAKHLYLQRVFGGGSEGDKAFDLVFWEPRARAPAEAAFELRDGHYTLTCGKQTIALKQVPAAKAKKLLAGAKLFDVRWQRVAYALARDDEGTWYFVDHARAPDDNTDFNLYVGTPGSLQGHGAQTLAHDQAGDLFRVPGGKLRLGSNGEVEWSTAAGKTKLTFLPVEDQARFIYTQLGAYRDLPLGTPCDGYL